MSDPYDILDKSLERVPGGLTDHEAFYMVLSAAVLADGEIHPNE
jgi:hypothetical protein